MPAMSIATPGRQATAAAPVPAARAAFVISPPESALETVVKVPKSVPLATVAARHTPDKYVVAWPVLFMIFFTKLCSSGLSKISGTMSSTAEESCRKVAKCLTII